MGVEALLKMNASSGYKTFMFFNQASKDISIGRPFKVA